MKEETIKNYLDVVNQLKAINEKNKEKDVIDAKENKNETDKEIKVDDVVKEEKEEKLKEKQD